MNTIKWKDEENGIINKIKSNLDNQNWDNVLNTYINNQQINEEVTKKILRKKDDESALKSK